MLTPTPPVSRATQAPGISAEISVEIIDPPDHPLHGDFKDTINKSARLLTDTLGNSAVATLLAGRLRILAAERPSVALKAITPERTFGEDTDRYGILYDLPTGVIVVPQLAIGKLAEKWSIVASDPERLANTLTHDTGHFVDQHLNALANGAPASANSEFRRCLLEEASTAKIDPDVVIHPFGARAHNYLPIRSNIPNPFEEFFDPPERDGLRYAEAFAEIFAELHNRGTVQVGFFRTVCPRTVDLVREISEKLLNRAG